MTDTAAPLRTGWEPAAPVDDTVTRRALLAHLARAEHTVRAVGGLWEIDDDVALADLHLPGLFANHVFVLQPGALEAGPCTNASASWP